jgi:hypothetical protein
MKMTVFCEISEMSVNFYKTTRHYVPEDTDIIIKFRIKRLIRKKSFSVYQYVNVVA